MGVFDTAEIHYPNQKGIILSHALTWKFNCTFIKHIVQCLLKHSLLVFLGIPYLQCHPFKPEKFHSVNNAGVFCLQFVSKFYWCEEVVYHDNNHNISSLLQIRSHPLKFDIFLKRFINRVNLFLSQAIKTIHEVFSILVHQKPNLSHIFQAYWPSIVWNDILSSTSEATANLSDCGCYVIVFFCRTWEVWLSLKPWFATVLLQRTLQPTAKPTGHLISFLLWNYCYGYRWGQ